MEHMLYWEIQTLKRKVAECGENWEGEAPRAKKPWTPWGWPQRVEVSGISKWVKKGSFHCNGEHGRNRFGKRLSSTSDTSFGEMSHRKIDMQLEFKSEEKAAESFAIIDVKVKLNAWRWSRNSKEPQHRYSWGEQGKRELQRRPCPPGQQTLSCEPSKVASLLPR